MAAQNVNNIGGIQGQTNINASINNAQEIEEESFKLDSDDENKPGEIGANQSMNLNDTGNAPTRAAGSFN